MISDTSSTLVALRRALLAILVLGMSGTLVELLLQRHIEDVWQLIPLALIVTGYLTLSWQVVRRSRMSLLVLRLLMLAFVGSGVLGMYFHYQANLEFQREIEPELSGSKLWWKVLQATTPPALAPGVMTQLGLIGLAYAYRHPAFAPGARILEENRNE